MGTAGPYGAFMLDAARQKSRGTSSYRALVASTVKTNVLIAPNLKLVLVDKIQIGRVRACYQYRKVSLVVRIDLLLHIF
jgi:hypothetical protein